MRVRAISASVCSGVVVVTLAGCGGSGSHKVDAVADLQAAQDALIKEGDLPDYVPQPRKPNDGEDETDKILSRTLSSCMHVASTLLDQDVPGEQRARSPKFTSGYETVTATIDVDPTKRTVDEGWAIFSRADFAGCFQRALTKALQSPSAGLPAGVTVGKISVLQRSISFGDRGVIHEINVPMSRDGRTLTLFLGLYSVQRGRAGITLEASSTNPNLNRSALLLKTDILMRTMVRRLGNSAI